MKLSRLFISLLAFILISSISNGEDWNDWEHFDDFGFGKPNKVTIDHLNRKWFATPSGAWLYDGVEWYRFTSSNSGLPEGEIHTIEIENNGNVWFGTNEGTVVYDGESWKTIDTSDSGLEGNSITGIAFEMTGGIWFATSSSISHIDNSGIWTKYPSKTDSWGEINSIAVDNNNYVWFATFNSWVWRFDGKEWRQYDDENSGIIRGKVTTISIAPDSSLWFGNQVGFSVLDGYSWKMYDSRYAGTDLTNGDVVAIDFDSEGNAWIATDYGFTIFDGQNWAEYPNYLTPVGENDPHSQQRIYDLAIDHNDIVWLVTSRGVYKYWGKAIRIIKPEKIESAVVGSTIDITWLAQGIEEVNIDYSMNGGTTWNAIVHNLDAKESTYPWTIPVSILPIGFYTDHIRIRVTADKPVDIFTETTIRVESQGFRESFAVYTPENSGLVSASVSTIIEDDHGVMWFGTDSGISRFDGADWETFTDENSTLPSNVIHDSTHDSDGALFFATEGGIAQYDGSSWKTWLNGKNVLQIVGHPKSGIWCTTEEYTPYDTGGFRPDIVIGADFSYLLYHFENNAWEQQTTAYGDTLMYFSALECDNTGNIWILVLGSLMSYDGISWNIHIPDSTINPGYLTKIISDSSGKLWLADGKHFTGLYSFDGELWQFHTRCEGAIDCMGITLFDLTIGTGNTIWCATRYGLNSFDGQSWRIYSSSSGWPVTEITNVYIDKGNVMWFASADGITLFDSSVVPVEEDTVIPESIDVKGNYPNPFNANTTIVFTLPQELYITVTMYNIMGQKVRTLASGSRIAGIHNISWDGCDNSGQHVSSGIYFYKIESQNHVKSGRMLLLK